jgi:hypothetical protein
VLWIYLIGFGVPGLLQSRDVVEADHLGDRRARARVLGVRRRGVPLRHREHPREPARGGALARAVERQTMRHVVLPQAMRASCRRS